MSNGDPQPPWEQWQRLSLRTGLGGLVVWALCALIWHRAAFEGYWFAWVFWVSLAFGALEVCFMQFLTRGAWSWAVQRPLEAGMATLPLMLVLLVPVLFAMAQVFPWAAIPLPESEPHKRLYLTTPFFTVRALICFGALWPMAHRMRYWSLREDESLMQPEPAARLRVIGAGGLVVYSICMLIASTDWVMSLEHKWFSTMFVVIFGIGQLLTALAASIAFIILVPASVGYTPMFDKKRLRDLGNLLMAFVIFWTYVTYGQFIIIWSGNLPPEITWFLHRSSPWWVAVVVVLLTLQFALPFAMLLSRATKDHPRRLAMVALLVFGMNILNNFWLVVPSFPGSHWGILLLSIPIFIGMGGLWVFVFLKAFLGRRAVPRLAAEQLLAAAEKEVNHG